MQILDRCMINKVKFKEEIFSYPVFDFLNPYLLKQVWRDELQLEESVLIVTDSSFEGLINLLEGIALELIEEFYVEPDHKKRSKYPSRYRKITLMKRNYSLDITSNPKDRIVFQIISLVRWLREVNYPA